MKRVNKRQALKAWCNGQEVGLLPCNARPGSIWISVSWHNPIVWRENKFNNDDTGHTAYWKDLYHTDNADEANFQSLINDFTYYNCNYETGYYPHFYLKENE